MRFLLLVLIAISLAPNVYAQKALSNGIFYTVVNHVKHWYKVAGAEHATVPIVVLHGGPGGNQYVFERTAGKELEKTNTVIYYEQRGCGRSDHPLNDADYSIPVLISDLEALRTQWKIERMILLGYSFGASLAMEYALAHPKHVQGLILQSFATLQDSAAITEQIAHFYSIADASFRATIDDILSKRLSLMETNMQIWNASKQETVIRFLCRDASKGKAMFGMWQESGLKNTGKMMAALIKEKRSVYLLDEASRIDVPVLLLIGLYDRNGGLLSSLKLHDGMKQSKLVVFENSGHFPDVEETDKYSAAINAWMKEGFPVKKQ